MPFKISPSRIARFYYLSGCERYFRYTATPKAEGQKQGVPHIEDEAGRNGEKLINAGFEWEEEVIESKLGNNAVLAIDEIGTKISDLSHDVPATLMALCNLKVGEYLYQPTLETPDGLYERYNLDRGLLHFSHCRPDLILCHCDASGKRTFQIIDIKASHDVKPSYRIQVACYALILREVLSVAGIDGEVDIKSGGVWLYNEEQPKWFELSQPIEALEAFFRDQMTAIFDKPHEDVFWHVAVRCEWCGYFNHCRNEAERRKSIGILGTPY